MRLTWFSTCFCLLGHVAGKLEPVVKSDDFTDQILRGVYYVDRLNAFKNFITFFGQQEFDNGSVIATSIQQRIMNTYYRSAIIAGSNTGSLNSMINSVHLILVAFSGLDDPNVKQLLETVSVPAKLVFIFIYQSKNQESLNETQSNEFFEWCHMHHFVRMMLIIKQGNTYEFWTFTYDTMLVKIKLCDQFVNELTAQKYFEIIKSSKSRWLISMYQRLPTIFLYNTTDQKDITDGNVGLGGVHGHLLATFMRYIHAKMDVYVISNYTDLALNAVGSRSIDISGNLVRNHSMAIYSSTVRQARFCLVVPTADRLPLCEYFSYLIKDSFFGFLFFIFAANVVIKCLSNTGMPLTTILYLSMRVSFTQGLTGRAFRRLRLPDKFIELSSYIFNFTMAGIIGAALVTALTLGFYQREITDEQSFLESGLRIMMMDDGRQGLFDINELPRSLADRVFFVDKHTLEQHIYGLNKSYAYIAGPYSVDQLDYIQKRLSRPKLRLASDKLCTASFNLRLKIRPELPLVYVLKSFLTRILEAGLFEKWQAMSFEHAKQLHLINQVAYEPPEMLPLPLEYFKRTFYLYAACMCFSLVVFALELALEYWIRQRTRVKKLKAIKI